ncbi:MAG TPA: 2'-5' RNA ligase family protein [Armatimonadota bacterium]|nr:2'-5' RNA ligase family protein [Armatimonadota bacterium]
MAQPLYALVAYVRTPLGAFVEGLRRDLNPQHPELPAHVTVLPPRPLRGPVEEALHHIEDVCSTVDPFEVAMGEVETFAPTTPTIFIRVAHAGYRIRELHDRLNQGALAYEEPWPYMPHLTIIKLSDVEAARAAADVSQQRWQQYGGDRRIRVEELTFVREGNSAFSWVDLAPVRLGPAMAGQRR